LNREAMEQFLDAKRGEFLMTVVPREPAVPDGRYTVEIVTVNADGDEDGMWIDWLFRCRDGSERMIAHRSRLRDAANWSHLAMDLARCGVRIDDPRELLAALDELPGKLIRITVAPNGKGRRCVYINRLLEVSK
jgi:hypothetical protein